MYFQEKLFVLKGKLKKKKPKKIWFQIEIYYDAKHTKKIIIS